MKHPDPQPLQPIPDHAKLAFHGILFDVYQWPQTMFDGSTKTFEKLTRRDTGTVIAATPDGQIVMTTQSQPGTQAIPGLPGGGIEPGEDPQAAVERELLQETGYAASSWTLWQNLYLHEKINYRSFTYLARNARPTTNPKPDSGERIQINLISLDQFMELMLDESFRDWEVALGVLRLKQAPARLAQFKAALGLDS